MSTPARGIRILGIDPGSRATGFGVIDVAGSRQRHVVHGVLRPAARALAQRLAALSHGLAEVIEEQRPDEVAMEQVFVRRNVATALILGQARGAALSAVGAADLPLHEYAPARIKQAVTGSGRADKSQVQKMISMLLALRPPPASDAADALACAICHAHHRASLRRAGAGA